MHYSFPYYDDPPAPHEPPQTYTPLSPPRSRHNLPSSSRFTPQSAPPHSQTWATSTPEDAKPKPRERASSHSPGSEPVRSNGANTNLFPPATPPCLGRRRTLSAASVAHRRDSVDMDARSIISSLLDAYCHSDVTDDAWDDGASEVYSDEMMSLASPSSSVCNHRRRRGSNSTIVASEFPTRRTNPPSLLIETSPRWGMSDSAPQTAPVTKNSRPLPSLPSPCTSQCHNTRPLPHPPLQPPPYTPTVGSNVASTSDIRPVPSSSFPRPLAHASSSSSSSSSSVPSSSSSTDSLGLSSASDQPLLSKFHSLPFLKIPPSPSSQQPSPLSSYMPVPPSPMTARRHQASKLSRILGEDISPEFLGPNRVARLPPPSNVSAPSAVNQRQTCKIKKILSLPTARRTKSRAVRPNAIYVHDDTSEESNIGNERKEDREKVSFLDFTDDEDSTIRQGGGGIKIDLLTEEEDDTASSVSDASEIMSLGDSVLEEIEDMEDARIGWALQNVITYQKAARVKRTSRMWVLEKNGQRWEEQDHMNVRQALRQL